MTVATVPERVMYCSRCGGEWRAPTKRPDAPVHCPYCDVHVCACGCGENLSSGRSNQIWKAEARALQEDAKPHWSMIIREGICEVLLKTGGYHADDLDHLGVPDEYRNLIGSQTAKLVNQMWMEEVGRRKSILPSRNGAKSGIYRLTKLGREKLAGVGAVGTVGADSGESGAGGQHGDHLHSHGRRNPGAASSEPAPRAGAEEEKQGEGIAGKSKRHRPPAPSTDGADLHRAPTSSGAGSEGDVLPGLEPTSYERMQDAA